jgi:hypothetical protein
VIYNRLNEFHAEPFALDWELFYGICDTESFAFPFRYRGFILDATYQFRLA